MTMHNLVVCLIRRYSRSEIWMTALKPKTEMDRISDTEYAFRTFGLSDHGPLNFMLMGTLVVGSSQTSLSVFQYQATMTVEQIMNNLLRYCQDYSLQNHGEEENSREPIFSSLTSDGTGQGFQSGVLDPPSLDDLVGYLSEHGDILQGFVNLRQRLQAVLQDPEMISLHLIDEVR